MPTNEERQKIAETLREIDKESQTSECIKRESASTHLTVISEAVGRPKGQTLWGRLADLIEPELERSCTFAPEAYKTALSEDGLEYDTNDPAEDCLAFLCSECDSAMMYGEWSWFETEPPYTPMFSYCPYCGAKVVSKDGD